MLKRIAMLIGTVIMLEAALFAIMGLSYIIPELVRMSY